MDAVKARDGFIVGGFTGMPCNVFLLKIDKEGNEIWNRTYGGRGDETLERIINCGDGYAFAGWTSSYGSGSWDAWLVKIEFRVNLRQIFDKILDSEPLLDLGFIE